MAALQDCVGGGHTSSKDPGEASPGRTLESLPREKMMVE